jgi:hypothetical protein
MGRPRGRPTPGVDEPDVHVEWVRAEPTPQQARAWRDLWRKLLAPEEQIGELAPSTTAIQEGDEAHDDVDQVHDSLQDL